MGPENHSARLEQAWTLFRLSRYREAEELVIRVIQEDPNNAKAHLLLGGIYSDNRKLPLALEQFQIALSIDPTLYHGHIFYSFALLQGNKTKQALEEVQHAIRLDPLRPEAYRSLAEIRFRQHDEALNKVKSFITKTLATKKAPLLDKALVAIDKALELDPNDSSYYEFKAEILNEYRRDHNDYSNAVALAEHSLSLDPTNGKALSLLGSLAADVGDMDAASDYFVHAAQTNPNDRLRGVHKFIATRTAIFYGIYSVISFMLYQHSKIAAVVVALVPFVLHSYFERKIQQKFSSNVQDILVSEQQVQSPRMYPLAPIAVVIYAAIFIAASFFWQKDADESKILAETNSVVETDCYSFLLTEFAVYEKNFAACSAVLRFDNSEISTIKVKSHSQEVDLESLGLAVKDYETREINRRNMKMVEYQHLFDPERRKAIIIDVRDKNLQQGAQDIAFISISTPFFDSAAVKEIDRIVQSFSLTLSP